MEKLKMLKTRYLVLFIVGVIILSALFYTLEAWAIVTILGLFKIKIAFTWKIVVAWWIINIIIQTFSKKD